MNTRKALFLDRDGVININYGYVGDAAQVAFIDGIYKLMTDFVKQGFQPIIVTNQSGIARGYYSEQQFHQLMNYFQDCFNKHDLPQVPVFYCPHHPDFDAETGSACQCRKPKPGMILEAASQFELDLSQSVFVGDKLTDMLAAKIAGVGRRVLFDVNLEQTHKLKQQTDPALHLTDFECVQSLSAIEVQKNVSNA